MSKLLDIQSKLQDTSAAIAQFERAYSASPNSASVSATLKSFEKRRRQLEDEFLRAAAQLGTDVCSYRFFADESKIPPLLPLCQSLANFQSLYSLTYDAIKTGPKKRSRRMPPELLAESAFSLGYTFAGSIGVVLTFQSDSLTLFQDSHDNSMGRLMALAMARTTDQIKAIGREVGVPTVRAMRVWAVSHIEARAGADIQWRKGRKVVGEMLLQLSDLRKLVSAIDDTTEVIEDEVAITAKLAGADVAKRTFHLEIPESSDIRGNFGETIPEDRTFEVGRVHNVVMRKRVKVYYSSDMEEDASYALLAATPC